MSENFVYEKIGALIKEYRRNLKMTQDELARRVGMSRGSISNIENGVQRLYPHQLYVFAKHLSSENEGISPASFLPDLQEEQLEEISGYKIEVWGGSDKSKSTEVDKGLLYDISAIREKALQQREKHDNNHQRASRKPTKKTKNKPA